MKRISIIGSTGSVGANALRVVEAHSRELKVEALAARRNAELLLEQARKFHPSLVCLYESEKAGWLERRLKKWNIRLVTGGDGLVEASTLARVDQVLFSMVGAVGLKPILAAIRAGKSAAIANKEPLVMAGDLLCREAERKGVRLIPIDSEHSGLWQCLEGHSPGTVKKLILTSSGGPFFRRKVNFRAVTSAEALRHPRWNMGPKISVDSATLMNKGLEVIEASHLFDMPLEKVDVLIHPESVVHALVEFVDGAHLAQLGITDMRLPIQYALSYPNRFENSLPSLSLTEIRRFHFYEPDVKRFPCLALGYEAKRRGGTAPAVLNAANEVAVRRFLEGSFRFSDIPKAVEHVMMKHKSGSSRPAVEDILAADAWARRETEELHV